MPTTRRRERYKPPSGVPIVVAPKAWGADFEFFSRGGEEPPPFEEIGDYAVIRVSGPMTKGRSWWGGTSYEEIAECARAAFDSSAAKVCLYLDTPGGDLAGCFECAHDLRAMAESSGKPLVAFTDGDCCSGGMALASAATGGIFATPQAFLGSIGVWAPLVDATGANEMWGVKVAIASSGEHKADWNPNVPMTEESFKRLQTQVMAQAELFYELVAKHRGTSVDALRDLKGAAPFGQAALAAGLCDQLVPSWSAFLAGETDMTATRSKIGKYADLMGELRALSEEDSEEGKKAKRALKAADEAGESDEDKEKREKEEKEKAAAAEKEKEKAQATITSLAATVQQLQADLLAREQREAAEKDNTTRAAIFAKRPDLSAQVREALETMPTAALEKAIENLPRINASPGGSVNAQFPAVTPGREHVDPTAPARPLTPEAQALFDKTSPFPRAAAAAPAGARMVGHELVLDDLPPEQSKARAEQLAKAWGFR